MKSDDLLGRKFFIIQDKITNGERSDVNEEPLKLYNL